MSKKTDCEKNASDPDMADNHKWADRLAADRQKGLEKIGLVAIVVAGTLAILLLLW